MTSPLYFRSLRLLPFERGLSGALKNMKRCRRLQVRCRLYVTLWNIGAARLFGVRVSSQSISPGSRPATDFFEFASAALSFKLGCVAQIAEQRRLAIYFGQFLFPDTTGRERKKAAREHFPFMGDEDESLAIVETARCPSNRVRCSIVL